MFCRSIVSVAFVIVAAACAEKSATHTAVESTTPAPDSFNVKFETSRGTFTAQIHRSWSPRGVDRFHDLVVQHFFDENRFFRVIPGYIAQFGVSDDPRLNTAWEAKPILDDPRTQTNARGTIVFASDTANTRSHGVFINISDNPNLDKQRFTPVGRVMDGMAVVDSIYSGYREKPSYHLLETLGNSYANRMFPKLDYIKSATIVP
jgi:peptidyl-prolyl cis-trans isomerase A (cyclophilin A)